MNQGVEVDAFPRARVSEAGLWVAAVGICPLMIWVLRHGISYGRLPDIVQIVASGIVIGLAITGRVQRLAIWVVAVLSVAAWAMTLFEIRLIGPAQSVLQWLLWPTPFLLVGLACLFYLIMAPKNGNVTLSTSSPPTSPWVWVMGAGALLSSICMGVVAVTQFSAGGRGSFEIVWFLDNARIPMVGAGVAAIISLRSGEARMALWILVAGFCAVSAMSAWWLSVAQGGGASSWALHTVPFAAAVAAIGGVLCLVRSFGLRRIKNV
ncbi:MAG: hypothetical protein QOE83_937 [Actinomycetota bacterium]|jgi:hypothetical protein|nr:hypothetical protein [Actinomycetota bacterium]